jgi:predicted metal-dependent hydrolase
MSTHETKLETALDLFNQAKFFEAHEALEDLWRGLSPSNPAKKHLQGLTQLAVAFHHESRGNLRGAKSVLDRALRNLAGAEVSFPNIELEQFHRDLTAWQSYLAHRKQRPGQPQITWRDGRS